MTGNLRGCDPGEGCEKYTPAVRKTPPMPKADIAFSANTENRRRVSWDIAQGYQMWASGEYSHSQIARELGTTPGAVSERVSRCWKHGKL